LNLDKLLTEYGVAETVVRDATASASTADTILAGDTAHSVLSAGPGMAVRPTIWRMTAIAILPLFFIIVFAWAYSMQGDAVTQQAESKTISEVEALPAPLGQLASVALNQQVASIKDKPVFEDTVKEQADVKTLENVIYLEDTADSESVIVEESQAVGFDVNEASVATNSNLTSGPGAAAMVAQHQSQDRLVIKVSEDSWVHITDAAGSRLFRDLARAGKKIDVSGELPFNLHLGNAPGLALELNGAPFAITDYRDDNSARFVIGSR
jgi:cytoskeleton protein RodZ